VSGPVGMDMDMFLVMKDIRLGSKSNAAGTALMTALLLISLLHDVNDHVGNLCWQSPTIKQKLISTRVQMYAHVWVDFIN
jgi:hypothetical protein